MPVRPSERARYPKNWKSVVVPRIRARSGNRCECTGQCGRQHIGKPIGTGRCGVLNGDVIDTTLDMADWREVVLTVMHLDHQPENCSDENLLHGCQACHNRYDAPVRAANLKARRRALQAESDLFKCDAVSNPPSNA